jgi:hypothetical protein
VKNQVPTPLVRVCALILPCNNRSSSSTAKFFFSIRYDDDICAHVQCLLIPSMLRTLQHPIHRIFVEGPVALHQRRGLRLRHHMHHFLHRGFRQLRIQAPHRFRQASLQNHPRKSSRSAVFRPLPLGEGWSEGPLSSVSGAITAPWT